MSPIQEVLDRVIAEKGPDGPMIQQLRNQIMADMTLSFTQLFSTTCWTNYIRASIVFYR